MSVHKTQNPILVIATLGVYFGLILAGATPQVLANAAMTRQFDVKDEIEVNDNLDKKPDSETLHFSAAVKEYFGDFEEIIESLQKYDWQEGFLLESDRFEFELYSSLSCTEGYDPVVSGSFSRKLGHQRIEKAIDSAIFDFSDWETFSDCLDVEGSSNHRIYLSKLGISYDTSHLELKISIPKKSAGSAELLAERLNRDLRIYEIDEHDNVITTSYKNTQIVSTNDQVFIITRLPRAGLASLLR